MTHMVLLADNKTGTNTVVKKLALQQWGMVGDIIKIQGRLFCNNYKYNMWTTK